MSRLREIQNQLNGAPEAEKYKLYCEAERLFSDIGKLKNAQQCRDLAAKYFRGPNLPDIPLELLFKIADYVDLKTRMRLKHTCQSLNSKFSSSLFWRNLSLSQNLDTNQFVKIWNLTGGKANNLYLEKAGDIKNRFVKEIKVLPTCLESLNISNCPHLDSKSLLIFLSAKPIRQTMKRVVFSQCLSLDNKCISRILTYFLNLEQLTIENCRNISNEALEITNRESLALKVLVFRQVAITMQGLQSLISKCASSLHSLVLSHLKSPLPSSIFELLANCNGLRVVQIIGEIGVDWNRELFEASFSKFALNCRMLRVFSLTRCPVFRDTQLSQLAENCLYLERLELPVCSNIHGLGLAVAGTLRNLYAINVRGSSRMNATTFQTFLRERRNSLRVINISNNIWVKDLVVDELAAMPNLEQLGMASCTAITSNGAGKLLKKPGSKMKVLDLSQNSQLSTLLVTTLKSALGEKAVIYSN